MSDAWISKYSCIDGTPMLGEWRPCVHCPALWHIEAMPHRTQDDGNVQVNTTCQACGGGTWAPDKRHLAKLLKGDVAMANEVPA